MKNLTLNQTRHVAGGGVFRDVGAMVGGRLGGLPVGLLGYGFGWHIENSINTDVNALANDIQTGVNNGEYVQD